MPMIYYNDKTSPQFVYVRNTHTTQAMHLMCCALHKTMIHSNFPHKPLCRRSLLLNSASLNLSNKPQTYTTQTFRCLFFVVCCIHYHTVYLYVLLICRHPTRREGTKRRWLFAASHQLSIATHRAHFTLTQHTHTEKLLKCKLCSKSLTVKCWQAAHFSAFLLFLPLKHPSHPPRHTTNCCATAINYQTAHYATHSSYSHTIYKKFLCFSFFSLLFLLFGILRIRKTEATISESQLLNNITEIESAQQAE